MSQKPIIDDADRIVGTGIDALLAVRPSAAPYVQTGTYAQIFKGIRAQLVLLLRRQTAAVMARRIPLANGTDLLNLVQSEIGTPPDLSAKFASGTLYISRVGEGTTNLPPGVIPKGTTFSRTANPTAALPVLGATYTSTVDVAMGPSNVGVFVPVTAAVSGLGPNLVPIQAPATDPNTAVITVPTLFDKTLICQTVFSDVSGGTAGATNGDLQKWARFAATQTNGPTTNNVAAQVLIENGVSNFAVLDDPYSASCFLWVADASWGSGPTLASNVQAQLDVGFGCVVTVYPVSNFLVGCNAAIVVKDPSYVSAGPAIGVNAQAAVRAYLDGVSRDDWYNWSTDGLQSAIIASDSRIATCTATLTQAISVGGVPAGTVLTPPTTDPRYNGSSVNYPLTHFYLAGNATTFTYTSI